MIKIVKDDATGDVTLIAETQEEQIIIDGVVEALVVGEIAKYIK